MRTTRIEKIQRKNCYFSKEQVRVHVFLERRLRRRPDQLSIRFIVRLQLYFNFQHLCIELGYLNRHCKLNSITVS